MRRRNRGFKLGRKCVKVFKWVFRSKRRSNGYQRLDTTSPRDYKTKTMTKIYNWGQSLKRGAMKLSFSCSTRSITSFSSDYCRMDRQPFEPKPIEVPKGHLAVYVGKKDDDPHRVLVPIIYFNHPLFGELLKEAEREYGYNHPGGITLPCPFSEFEKVKTRIAAGRR
ncbi:Auxin-responsive protein saur36 [Thalictrum thalictroides]|uniref:Auxin-responsive protein saur36 n=1 Tax=Thalictrum thalictroides TaxID=46969 RepID=A0A7J6VBZ4_THATH|nr:Auxin-responsive protein saur36 [Thalictrum thalictroides]